MSEVVEIESRVPKESVALLARVEESRAVAEIKGAIAAAKADPRDTVGAQRRIVEECKRKSLAEKASYAYPKGGQVVTGPSIRLAEVLARNWGNLDTGIIELETNDKGSTVMAFARDLEANYTKRIVFFSPHEIETKKGTKLLTSPRDRYENMANMGSRRLRACILGVIPADIVESAEEECEKTLSGKNEVALLDRVRAMVKAFETLGVNQQHLEKRLGHKIDATIGPELVSMQKIFNSIRDSFTSKEEWFDFGVVTTGGRAAAVTEKITASELAEEDKLPFEKEPK